MNGTVEILDLEWPNVACQPMQDLPINLTAATGQLIQFDKPIICSGIGLVKEDSYHESYDCFLLRSKHWEKISPLEFYVQHASSALVDINGREEIVITGGIHAHANEISSNVPIYDGQAWIYNKFSNLPDPVYKHCLLR